MAIVSGYQKMKDYIKQSSGYKLLSRWANANTLECDDGKTLQSKVGGISGISSSLTANSTTQAASTNLTNQLYQNINGKLYNDSISGTASMSLKDATKYVCDNYVGLASSARGRFTCAEGWYDYDLIKSADDYCSGIINGHTTLVTYACCRLRGADAVLKKLGSVNTVSFTVAGYATNEPNYWECQANNISVEGFNTISFGALQGADARNDSGVVSLIADGQTIFSKQTSLPTVDISGYSMISIQILARYAKSVSLTCTLSV